MEAQMQIDAIEFSFAIHDKKNRQWFSDFEVTVHLGVVYRILPVIWFGFRKLST
jgi:hypothetical protein